MNAEKVSRLLDELIVEMGFPSIIRTYEGLDAEGRKDINKIVKVTMEQSVRSLGEALQATINSPEYKAALKRSLGK